MSGEHAANPNERESAVNARLAQLTARAEQVESMLAHLSGIALSLSRSIAGVTDQVDAQTDMLEERVRAAELRVAASELTVARLLDRAADHEGRLVRLESGGGGHSTRLKDVESSVTALLAEVTVLVRAMSVVASVQEQ
jgi:Asp-tRNA(Asn)/Glu-tRNA(Gln) amidotransferase C subunit